MQLCCCRETENERYDHDIGRLTQILKSFVFSASFHLSAFPPFSLTNELKRTSPTSSASFITINHRATANPRWWHCWPWLWYSSRLFFLIIGSWHLGIYHFDILKKLLEHHDGEPLNPTFLTHRTCNYIDPNNSSIIICPEVWKVLVLRMTIVIRYSVHFRPGKLTVRRWI